MNITETIRQKICNYLRIDTSKGLNVNIDQLMDFEANAFKNKLWYRGMANELQAFYAQTDDGVGNRHFWGSRPTTGMNIRKIHTGLPGTIVNVLADVCTDDFCGIKLEARQDEWESIAKRNNFDELIAKAVKNVLVFGDGAFKLSYDSNVSQLPIIEFFTAERVDYEYTRGMLTGIVFKTPKTIAGKAYVLKEFYRSAGITYLLEDMQGKTYPTSSFEEFSTYKPVNNNAGFIPAVQFKLRDSKLYEGRGESIFAGKIDNFDAFDEVFSQWMLALRKGQIKSYIPESLLPRDPKTGELKHGSDFDNDFISVESIMAEGDSNKITTTQGEIQHDALLSTYCTALDLCLQGVISPSTLGIDVKKLDNAEAQREKEKTTLYTRNKVVDVLSCTLVKLVEATFMFCDALEGKAHKPVEAEVSFGGYANPSFEANVETVGKASQYGIMSIETQVDELYGDDKSAEWKAEEVRRIKSEKGIVEAEEPSINQIPLGFAAE